MTNHRKIINDQTSMMNQRKKNEKLLNASKENDLNKIKEAINEGADILFYCNYGLQNAAIKGRLDIVKYLVKIGTDANMFRSFRDIPFIWAVVYGHLDIVKYLVKIGADVYSLTNLTLEEAQENGHIETVRFINLCKKDDKMSKNLVKIMLRDV